MNQREKLALLDAMLAGEEPMRELRYRSPDSYIREQHGPISPVWSGFRDRMEAKQERRTRSEHLAYMEDLQARAAELRDYFERGGPDEWLELGPREDGRPMAIPAEMDEEGLSLINGRPPRALGLSDDYDVRFEKSPHYLYRTRRRVAPNVEPQVEKLLSIFEGDEQFQSLLRSLRESP